jgi:hypothetical protein
MHLTATPFRDSPFAQGDGRWEMSTNGILGPCEFIGIDLEVLLPTAAL